MDKKVVSDNITHYRYVDTPLGLLLLAGCKDGLRMINFPNGPQARNPLPHWKSDSEMFSDAAQQITEYFAGTRYEFDFPMILEGTDFQKRVWAALLNIKYGQLASYGDVAKTLGSPGAARAVGGANNANPIPIVIPCHRIIGADKSLTGFGGGLDVKQILLDHENKHGDFPERLL